MSNKRKHLLIRADASYKIGSGHIMRCLALGQSWQDLGGTVTFACANLPERMHSRLLSENMEVQLLNTVTGSPHDAEGTLSLAEHCSSFCIVMDGYNFTQQYHDRISEIPTASLTIDDYGQIDRYNSSFVLNQNYGITKSLYKNCSKETKLLLGTKYSLIRREFRTTEKRQRTRDRNITKVLVTLGGSDPTKSLETVVHAIKGLADANLSFRIIAGPMNTNFNRLKRLANTDRRIELFPAIDDMATAYTWADLAIAAAGSTNWEMCCFNLPRILIIQADNQAAIAETLLDRRIAHAAHKATELTRDAVQASLKSLISACKNAHDKPKQAEVLVDARGAERVAKRLIANQAGIQHEHC